MDLTKKDTGKTKVLNTFSASVSIEMASLQAPEPWENVWNKATSPPAGEDQVWEHFNQLDRCNKIDSQVLREIDDDAVMPLSIILSLL